MKKRAWIGIVPLLCSPAVLLHCSSTDSATPPGHDAGPSGDDAASGSDSNSGGDTGTGGDAGSDAAEGDSGHDAAASCNADAGQTACGSSCVDLQSDGANCGSCGHDCLGGSCSAGACQPVTLATVTSAIGSFGRITTDGQNVAWTIKGAAAAGGGVYSVLATGANQTPVTIASQADTYDGVGPIAMHGGSIYWLQKTSVSGVASLDKGTAQQAGATALSTWGTGVTGYGLAVNSTGTTLYDLRQNTTTGIDVGNCDTANGNCNGMWSVSSATGMPIDIVTDDTNVYWTETDGYVRQMPVGSTTPTTVAMQGTPGPVGVASGYVYWSDDSNGSIWRSPVTSQSPTKLTTQQGTQTLGLAVDGKNVYYAQFSDDHVYAMPAAGGSPAVLATGSQPGWMTTDGKALYWLNQGDGTVRKIALP